MGDFSSYLGTGQFPNWTTQSVGGNAGGGGFLDRISGFLGNPNNQAAMLAFGKGLSQPRVVGGHLVNTTGQTMADAMLPLAQGKVQQGVTQGVATATGKAAEPMGTALADDKPTPLSELQSNTGLTGITVTPTKDGLKYTYQSHGPEEAAKADVLNRQLQQGVVSPYMGTGGGGTTPIAAGLGNQNPTVSPGTAGGQGVNAPARGVAGYNLATYNPNPEYASYVGKYYNNLTGIDSPQAANQYIQSKYPGAPVTGDMIWRAAAERGVDPKMLMSMFEIESRYGTLGLATKTRNPGNVGGDTPAPQWYAPDWQRGVGFTADWLANHPAEKAFRDRVASPEVMFAQNMGPQPTMIDIPQSPAQPYRTPDYSNVPSAMGLTPEMVDAAYRTGANIARVPATIETELANAEANRTQAQAIRLGLPTKLAHEQAQTGLFGAQAEAFRRENITKTPMMFEGLPVTGKDILEHKEKMAQLDIHMQQARSQLESAQSLTGIRQAQEELARQQQKKIDLENQDRQMTLDLLKEKGNEIIPYTKPPMTYKEAHQLGILHDLLRGVQQVEGQTAISERALATDVRKAYAELRKSMRDPMAISEMKASAKKLNLDLEQYVDYIMTQSYGKNWHSYLGQEAPPATGGATYKYDPTRGVIP